MPPNMENTRDFDSALDRCLDALLTGDSIDSCLARFPEHAVRLEPLLLAARQIIELPHPAPSPELKSETLRALDLTPLNLEEARFHDALNHCLDLLTEGKSVDQCVEHYPEMSSLLTPLLATASTFRESIPATPRPEFKAEARRRVLSHVEQRRVIRWLPIPSWRRWAYRGAVAAAAFLIMFSAGQLTLRASSDSSPGDALYPVKEFSESVRMTLATSQEDEARLHVELAGRRAQEMADAVADGDHEMVEELLVKLETHLEEAPRLMNEKQFHKALEMVMDGEGKLDHSHVRDLLAVLNQDIRTNEARLKDAMYEVPPDMLPELEDAIARVRNHYSVSIATLEAKRSTDDLDSLNGVRLTFRK